MISDYIRSHKTKMRPKTTKARVNV